MAAGEDRTWRRFTATVAALGGFALVVGLALSYASVYKMALNAGFDAVWLEVDGRQVRPAHLFPLTLDVPVLVGYAGVIALAGRRSVGWAKFVLSVCSVATIAAQVIDGAGWVVGHTWVRAIVHGWPPALAVLTAHLFVKILQALGYLVPPVDEPTRPAWVVRVWSWVVHVRADIRSVRATEAQATDEDTQLDTSPDTHADTDPDTPLDRDQDIRVDMDPDIAPDTRPDTDLDTHLDMSAPSGVDTDPDMASGGDSDNQQVNGQLSAPDVQVNDQPDDQVVTSIRKHRKTLDDYLDDLLADRITQAEVARRLKVSSKTVQRAVQRAKNAGKAAQRQGAAR